jgi:predicted transposase/invertase (TIGR01784 family)
MAKYLDPKNDLVFKRIFGEHKHLCMSLLNSMLPFEKGQEIIDLEYLPGELIPELIGYRHSIIDVRCKDSFGRQFLVEMQIRYTKQFNDRMLYNVCKAYTRQLEKSEDFGRLKPVYALIFLDTNMNDLASYYHHYKILDKENPNHQLKGIEFIFVELRKFKPTNIAEKRLHDL